MLSPRGGRPHDAPSSTTSPRHAGMGAGGCGRVHEWEAGLPTADELTPFSHPLIPPALAAAFRINVVGATSSSSFPFGDRESPDSHLSFRYDDEDDDDDGGNEDAVPPGPGGGEACRAGKAGKKKKKKRMVWTAVLHRRFVEAVAHLGEKAAVPKAIVEVMNVEGITRENVASHLQKYRLYLKRTSAHAAPPGPPTRGAPFSPQPFSDTSNRSGCRAFLSRDGDGERALLSTPGCKKEMDQRRVRCVTDKELMELK